MNDKQQLMALGEEMAEGCFAWRNIAAPNGLRRYMTDKQYQRQTAGIKKWYEPYRCANCREAEHAMASPTWVGFELDRYDAGSLNDFGGGYIDWWWDYLRAELDRAFDFYQGQIDALMGAADASRIAACLRACEGFDTAYLERAQFDSGYLPGAEHAATQRQRDELLEALEALVVIIADAPRPDPDDVFATIDEARRVINKVRG